MNSILSFTRTNDSTYQRLQFDFKLVVYYEPVNCGNTVMEMSADNDPFVIEGPVPMEALPEECMGKIIYDSLLHNTADHVAMIDGFTGAKISYQKILEDSCTLAEALRAYGCTEQTVVSISSENSLQFFVPVIAAFYVGCTVAPLNHNYSLDELRHALSITQPKLVFCSINAAQKFINLKRQFPFLEKIVVIDNLQWMRKTESVQYFVNTQLKGRRISPEEIRPFNGNPTDHLALIMSSSGTTGLPKGVMLTDRNIATRLAQTRDLRFNNNSETTIAVLPFFHSYGFQTGITSICNKTKMIVLKRFDEDVFLKVIRDYKIATLWIAPPLAVFLAKTHKLDEYDLSSVRWIWCGAAPLSKATEDILMERFKNVYGIRQGYGLTEITMAATMFQLTDKKSGSCGKVMPYIKIKVRDLETGKTLGPNQVGEICIKGASVTKGYYRNEGAIKDIFLEDGWLRSGDLGYYDEEKYFFIVDRLKELIKYKGYQVPPAELEAILLNHPKVLDVGVVGMPDELAGELPVAFIVKKAGVDVTEKELVDYVKERVSPQKRLRGGVIFVNSIPKNPSGKILRRELREILKTYMKMKSKL